LQGKQQKWYNIACGEQAERGRKPVRSRKTEVWQAVFWLPGCNGVSAASRKREEPAYKEGVIL